jgi:hypothetical protein
MYQLDSDGPEALLLQGPDDRPVSDTEAAAILKKKPLTLATWRSQGRGPRYLKVGRHVQYTVGFLKEYLATCERVPEPAAVRRQRRALAAEAASTSP